jgi:hypothetical protein
LYQWGDGIEIRGDGRAKRLGTPALEQTEKYLKQKFTKKQLTNETWKQRNINFNNIFGKKS